jgi:hypothetical protein
VCTHGDRALLPPSLRERRITALERDIYGKIPTFHQEGP